MLRRSFSVSALSRLRRSFWFLFTFFLFCVIVFTDRDAYPLFAVNPWRYVIIEDPLDFDVPISAGNRFISIGEDGREVFGKKFPEEVMRMAQFMDDFYASAVTTFEDSEVVYVIYASYNHFGESREAILKLREITDAKLYYYDIGLQKEQLDDLKTVCNLEIVRFNFETYPNHTRSLLTYAFKPILMAEMYRKHRAFWVIDASARFFNSTELTFFYNKVRIGNVEPFTAEHPAGHPISAGTNSKIYSYLPLPMKKGQKSGMRQALTMFVVRSKMSTEVIKWNMICALTQACIAPIGTNPFCHPNAPIKEDSCHRFDQSSLNIILCALKLRAGQPCLSNSTTTGAFSNIVGVERESRYSGPLPTC